MHLPCAGFVLCTVLIFITSSKCETPSCRSNCTTDEECWQKTIAYHSAELIEQLFSFSNLAVYIDKYQRSHSSEVKDSIAFIDETLEDNLSTELVNSGLTMDLFNGTRQLLMEFCRNLISEPVEAVDELPSLICSSSTCSSDTMNFLVIFIISVILTSAIALLCFGQSFRTYRQAIHRKILPRSISFSTRDPNVDINSNRF